MRAVDREDVGAEPEAAGEAHRAAARADPELVAAVAGDPVAPVQSVPDAGEATARPRVPLPVDADDFVASCPAHLDAQVGGSGRGEPVVEPDLALGVEGRMARRDRRPLQLEADPALGVGRTLRADAGRQRREDCEHDGEPGSHRRPG